MEVFGRERQSGGKEKEDIVARRVKITTAHFACQTSLSLSLLLFSIFLLHPFKARISLLSSPMSSRAYILRGTVTYELIIFPFRRDRILSYRRSGKRGHRYR